MCGIVGYRGNGDASKIVYDGLKNLEYRGYDSAGIAVRDSSGINVDKGVGTVDESLSQRSGGSIALGHTRWATHGGVTEQNAHPHTDCKGEVAVVHNGIIQNYSELKQKLSGHKFKSDTDTEVIPHLIEEQLEQGKSLKQIAEYLRDTLEGSYAVVAMFESGEMMALKNRSPLALGIKEEELFLGSDVTPFLKHTDEAIFLEDGDYVLIDQDYKIYSDGEEVEREVEKIEWDAEQATKKGYEHFMEKEILEQPKTVKRAAFQDRKDMEQAEQMIEDAEKVWITGCGTSSYAADLGARYLRRRGVDVRVEQSHELEYRTDEIGEEDLVIGISQSGETADLLSVLEKLDNKLLSVLNVSGSTLDRKSDHTLHINAGPEIGVASTKAFTAQITVLKLLSYCVGGELEQGRDSLVQTADRIQGLMDNSEQEIERLSEYLVDKDDVYFIGRHKGFEMAKESALKLKELSYIHAEAFPGGEFKHGTLALVEDGVPVVGFLKQEGYEEMLSNLAEAKSRGADIIGVGQENGENFEFFIDIPEDQNSEILEVVPFQMLAYKTAVKLGNNPDKPRNLAKSVTVK